MGLVEKEKGLIYALFVAVALAGARPCAGMNVFIRGRSHSIVMSVAKIFANLSTSLNIRLFIQGRRTSSVPFAERTLVMHKV